MAEAAVEPIGGIHLLHASEKVRRDDDFNFPEIEESERAIEFQFVKLEALLLKTLTSFRRKDSVHILDMIGAGRIDATWPARFARRAIDHCAGDGQQSTRTAFAQKPGNA
jgi:hypothetical protein